MTTTAPDRSKRDECWKARDQLFACLEGHTLEQERDTSTCEQLRRLLKETCPASWESHFVQKHLNERRRKQELQSIGAKDINQAIKDGDVQYVENAIIFWAGAQCPECSDPMCYVSLTGSPPSNALLEEAVFHRSTEMLSIIKEPELVLWEGTTKVNAQYYGLHSNYPGFYVIDPAKLIYYLKLNCKLRPYVAATTDRRQSRAIAPKNVQDYIDQATGPSHHNKSKKILAPKVVVEPAPLSDL